MLCKVKMIIISTFLELCYGALQSNDDDYFGFKFCILKDQMVDPICSTKFTY